jgi:hypothetical protein
VATAGRATERNVLLTPPIEAPLDAIAHRYVWTELLKQAHSAAKLTAAGWFGAGSGGGNCLLMRNFS